ncbi:MAG: thiamine-phosphate kinase [Alphaproteobacteria bacterium PRO2]|nr:thiamine-phosphate kinase [Alphaproteobacteria bacterium PRO2]
MDCFAALAMTVKVYMNEFDVIEKYFRPLTQGRDALQDDAAALDVPAGQELIVTSDTSNAGTHFMADAAPGDIAHKVLRVNLSDLAAMGAKPHAYQLNIAFPNKPQEAWLAEFTAALFADQKQFGIFCSGGDTTTINGPLSISITAMGFAPKGKALRRSGAKPGDHIILTGPVGDALMGLRILQGKIKTDDDNYFINAYYRPTPRTAHIETLRTHASAAIDISDGLVADVGHVCKASGCGAEIKIVPGIFSVPARKVKINAEELLTGGDDYELLLAVRPEESAALLAQLGKEGLSPVKIGAFTESPAITVLDEKSVPLSLEKSGWRHF